MPFEYTPLSIIYDLNEYGVWMNGWKIGYVRVSTVDQNTERQLIGIELDKTFEEKVSANTLDRPQLNQIERIQRENPWELTLSKSLLYAPKKSPETRHPESH